MKFTLVEAEIKQALQDYAAKMITLAPGCTIDIEVKATRGADGVTAEIDVTMPGSVPTAPAAPVQAKREAVAPAAPQQPVAEVIGQNKPAEPELPNEDDVPLDEPTPEDDVPADPPAGKSIFG